LVNYSSQRGPHISVDSSVVFHPDVSGLNPKHTIYASSIYSHIALYLSLCCAKDENKQKRGWVWRILKTAPANGATLPKIDLLFG